PEGRLERRRCRAETRQAERTEKGPVLRRADAPRRRHGVVSPAAVRTGDLVNDGGAGARHRVPRWRAKVTDALRAGPCYMCIQRKEEIRCPNCTSMFRTKSRRQ